MLSTSTAAVRLTSLMLCMLFLNHNGLCSEFKLPQYAREEGTVVDYKIQPEHNGPSGPGPAPSAYNYPPPPSEGDLAGYQLLQYLQDDIPQHHGQHPSHQYAAPADAYAPAYGQGHKYQEPERPSESQEKETPPYYQNTYGAYPSSSHYRGNRRH